MAKLVKMTVNGNEVKVYKNMDTEFRQSYIDDITAYAEKMQYDQIKGESCIGKLC